MSPENGSVTGHFFFRSGFVLGEGSRGSQETILLISLDWCSCQSFLPWPHRILVCHFNLLTYIPIYITLQWTWTNNKQFKQKHCLFKQYCVKAQKNLKDSIRINSKMYVNWIIRFLKFLLTPDCVVSSVKKIVGIGCDFPFSVYLYLTVSSTLVLKWRIVIGSLTDLSCYLFPNYIHTYH